MGTETWIISLPLSDSILYLKIIHPPNFREEPEKRSHEMSDVHFMAPFNDYITCRTALFRIPGSDKFHGWYGTGRNQKSSFPIRKEVKSNERTS